MLNVKAISSKGLNKDLISGYKILNGTKYFSSCIFQNYLKNTLNILVAVPKFIRGNPMECQKKILKI